MTYSTYLMIYYSLLYYSLNLEPRSFATAIYYILSSLSNGGLQVHSKVLTGSVPGYLLGQTVKVRCMKMRSAIMMTASTRMSPGQTPSGMCASPGLR